VRVAHDVALLDLAVLLEETRNLFFAERGVDARDEQVGARVAALVLVVPAGWRRATGRMSVRSSINRSRQIHTDYRGRCHGRWGRRCGHARRRRDGHHAETCCDRARSREARLHASQYLRQHHTSRRQTVVGALFVFVLHGDDVVVGRES
jgi:hypothetical protein